VKGRERLCVLACVLSMSVGEVSMGHGAWAWACGKGKGKGKAMYTMYTCSCRRTLQALVGPALGWAGLGRGRLLDGWREALPRERVWAGQGWGLGTEHTRKQAWRASKILRLPRQQITYHTQSRMQLADSAHIGLLFPGPKRRCSSGDLRNPRERERERRLALHSFLT